MSTVDSLALHRALGVFMAEASGMERLVPELARARREFLGIEAPDQDPLRQLATEARFAEWYLLERESEVLGEVPLGALARSMKNPPQTDVLSQSTVGVFLVEGGDELLQLRDLQGRAACEMHRLPMLDLAPGDVLVGRLFEGVDGHVVPSSAVAVKAAAEDLVAAFQRDLLSLDLDRRLTQVELEHLLFRRWRLAADVREQGESSEQVSAQLDELLVAHGVGDPTAGEISAAMRETDNPGSVMGPLLEQLAFDTDINLEQLRSLLLELWNAHAAEKARSVEQPPAPASEQPSPGDSSEGLGASLARRIKLGRDNQEDMEKVFEDVAELLGEGIEDDDDDPGAGTAKSPPAAFDGDLEPLIQEFIWEQDCGGGYEEEVLAQLLAQQREAPVPNLHLEFLSAGDLLRMVLRFYLDAAPGERSERVLRVFAVLEQFCEWGQRTQEYPLLEPLETCRRDFVAELERLQRAGEALSSDTADLKATPRLLRVIEVGPEVLEVAGLEGSESDLVAPGGAADDLRQGDLLLAALDRKDAGTASLGGMVVVLPAAAESLLG